MKVTYPAIFTETDTNILIEIPDLDILTESNEEGKAKGTMADAIMMARDAIGLTCISLEDDKKDICAPSNPTELDIKNSTFYEEGKSIISLVDIDLSEYRRKIDTKTVRRNVALPSWLDYEASKAGVNVSRILQEALISTLKLERII